MKRARRPSDPSTRERVVGAATRLFADGGYGLTSMRDIARAARIRAATLYHHFKSKDQLYHEVLEREQAKLRELMNTVLAEETEFPRQIERMVTLAFDYHRKNPSLAKLGLRAALGDGLTRPYDSRWLGMMEALLIGETSKMETVWTDDFRRTGTLTLQISTPPAGTWKKAPPRLARPRT